MCLLFSNHSRIQANHVNIAMQWDLLIVVVVEIFNFHLPRHFAQTSNFEIFLAMLCSRHKQFTHAQITSKTTSPNKI